MKILLLLFSVLTAQSIFAGDFALERERTLVRDLKSLDTLDHVVRLNAERFPVCKDSQNVEIPPYFQGDHYIQFNNERMSLLNIKDNGQVQFGHILNSYYDSKEFRKDKDYTNVEDYLSDSINCIKMSLKDTKNKSILKLTYKMKYFIAPFFMDIKITYSLKYKKKQKILKGKITSAGYEGAAIIVLPRYSLFKFYKNVTTK